MNAFELIETIAFAFCDVEQPQEITLYVAEAHDSYDYENNLSNQKKDFIGVWREIPDKHIEECQNALSHVDKVGMRYYLPAYMVWTLKNINNNAIASDHALYSLDDHSSDKLLAEYQKERFSLFSPLQMEACALFVKYCAEDNSDSMDSYFAQAKYDEHWNRYVRS